MSGGTSSLAALLAAFAAASAGPASDLWQPPVAKHETVLAICTAPKGRVHKVGGPAEGWEYERYRDVIVTILSDPQGRADVIFSNRIGNWRLRTSRTRLSFSHRAKDDSHFILTVAHRLPRSDTFQVSFDAQGRGRLAWSSVRTMIPPKMETSSSLMVADCTR